MHIQIIGIGQWAQLIYHHMTFCEAENTTNSLILKQYANSTAQKHCD